MSYLHLLRERPNFRLLWIAQVISLTGDWFNTIATVILVNRYLENSTFALSGLFLARSLPVFFASPLAGWVADRVNRKWILIFSNWIRVLIVLGFLLVDRPERIWLVYALSVAQFVASAFFEPAYGAILPSLIPKADLLKANTLGGVTWSVMLTFGAVIGGVVAGVAGVESALLIDAGTFVVAGVIISFIRPEFTPEPMPPSTLNQFSQFAEGWKFIRSNPPIAWAASVKALMQVGSVDVAIAVYAERVFPLGEDGASTLGLLFAAHGLGAVVGPLLGAWANNSSASLHRWISVGFVWVVVGWFIMGIAPSLPIALLGMVIRGMGGSLNWIYSTVILQLKTPDSILGRVFGLDMAFFTLTMALSTLFMGLLLDTFRLSPQAALVLIAGLSLLPLALWMSVKVGADEVGAGPHPAHSEVAFHHPD